MAVNVASQPVPAPGTTALVHAADAPSLPPMRNFEPSNFRLVRTLGTGPSHPPSPP